MGQGAAELIGELHHIQALILSAEFSGISNKNDA